MRFHRLTLGVPWTDQKTNHKASGLRCGHVELIGVARRYQGITGVGTIRLLKINTGNLGACGPPRSYFHNNNHSLTSPMFTCGALTVLASFRSATGPGIGSAKRWSLLSGFEVFP